MYPVSSTYMDIIRGRSRQDRLTGSITLSNGTEIPISDSIIKAGSVSLVSNAVSGEELEFGTAILSALDIGIRTDTAENAFYDAVINISFETLIGEDSWETVPLGVFTVKEATRDNKYVIMTAYDRLSLLKKEYAGEELTGTPYEVLSSIATACGITLAQTSDEISAMPNGTRTVSITQGTGLTTYQACVSAVCQLLAGFAVANRLGQLEIRHYKKTATLQIPTGGRFSLAPADYTVRYNGVTVYSYTGKHTAEDNSITDGIEMVIKDAPAWDIVSDQDSDLQERTDELFAELKQISYTPATAMVLGDPAIDCGDLIHMPQNGVDMYVLVTGYTWNHHGRMQIESVGSSAVVEGTGTNSDVKIIRGRLASITVDLDQISSEMTRHSVEIGSLQKEQSAFSQNVDSIEASVSLQEQTLESITERTTSLEVAAGGLEVSVSQLDKTVTQAAEDVKAVTEVFHFSENGLTISNTATGMGINVSEQQVEFSGGAQAPTTLIKPTEMETTNVRVKTRLDVGGFALIPRTNGNLSLRYTGGNE